MGEIITLMAEIVVKPLSTPARWRLDGLWLQIGRFKGLKDRSGGEGNSRINEKYMKGRRQVNKLNLLSNSRHNQALRPEAGG